MTKVNYKAANIYTCEGVRLLPGINVIPEGKAEAFLANPGVQARIDIGTIEVMGKGASDAPPTAKELIEEIGQTYDVAALKRIVETDERTTVRKAAEEQLALIDATGGDDGNAD